MKTGPIRHRKTGVVVVIGIKLKGGFRDKLAFKADHPHAAPSVGNLWKDAVHFPFGDKTDERCFEAGGFEVDEMVEGSFRSDDEFFEVVGMRLIRHGFQSANFVLVDGKNPEQGCHKEWSR